MWQMENCIAFILVNAYTVVYEMVYISIGLGKIGLGFVRMEPASRLFALTIPARVWVEDWEQQTYNCTHWETLLYFVRYCFW